MLTIAVKAARRAGSIINRAALDLDGLTVISKRQNDFVTEVDKAAEHAIIEILHKAYPAHAILAEESRRDGDAEYTWIIDPLDGTTNFIHGFPQYACRSRCAIATSSPRRWSTTRAATSSSLPRAAAARSSTTAGSACRAAPGSTTR